MISYVPLSRKLKEKSLHIGDVATKLEISSDSLRKSLNKCQYISVSTLLKICEALQCDIDDVISWEEGEQQIKKENNLAMKSIDWDKLTELKGSWSWQKLSLELGHISNFLQKGKGRKAKLQPVDVEKLEQLIGCKKGEFLSASPKE